MDLVKVTLFATGLAMALLLSGSDTAVAHTDFYGTTGFHPFTLENCTPPTADSHGRGNCDPVNLIFPGKTPFQVRDALRAKGWTSFGLGGTQYLHTSMSSTLVPQTLQVWRSDGAGRQYHVRLWATQGVTIGAVHHESGFFEHTLDKSWEASEAFVAGQLCPTARSCTSTSVLSMQNAVQGGDGEWRGWANDARARVITLR